MSRLFSEQPRLVDCDAMDGITTNILDSTDSEFRDKLVDRDGTCPSTGEIAWLCNACHIIPHSKGDNVGSLRISFHRITTFHP